MAHNPASQNKEITIPPFVANGLPSMGGLLPMPFCGANHLKDIDQRQLTYACG